MKKQLNTHGVLNELKGGSHFFTASVEAESPPLNLAPNREALTAKPQLSRDEPTDRAVDQSAKQLTNQPTELSTTQPTTNTTTRSTSASTISPTEKSLDRSPILGRPKAFYITEQQDRDLDLAVTKLGQHTADKIGQKIDRSTVLRLLLEAADLTNDHTIERLTSQLVSRLIRQLTG